MSRQIQVFNQIYPAYSLIMFISLGAAIAFFVWRGPAQQRGPRMDLALAALLGGILLGRLEHVWLNAAYFEANPQQILRFSSGGLDWHGAFIGAFFAALLMGRWRGLPYENWRDAAALALPWVALAAWTGCRAATCAYGAEIETPVPAWLSWDAQDIFGIEGLRFATQNLGMLGAALLLGLCASLQRLGLFRRGRLALMLCLLAAGMFILGFLRGDYAVIWQGLRLDQSLDLILLAYGLCLMLWQSLRYPHPDH